jgi:coproporphyrinogen III oxidase-like Fe-S oxidoreductase
MRHEIVNPLAMSLYKDRPELLVEDDELFWMTCRTQQWMEEKGYEQNGRFTSEEQFPYRYHWLKEMPFISLGARSRSHAKGFCCDKHEDLSLYFRLVGQGIPPIARYMALSKTEQMYRSLFLNIQLRSGLSSKGFEERFGENALEVFAPLLARLEEWGCIESDPAAVRLGRYGRYFVEDVCCYIVDQAVKASEQDSDLKRMPHSSGAFTERRASRLKIIDRQGPGRDVG